MSEAQLPGREIGAREYAHIRHRYAVASRLCRDSATIDIGCGSGAGLPMLRRAGRLILAGDRDHEHLIVARMAAPDAPLVQFDAEQIPLRSASVECVLALEMAQYLSIPLLLTELKRVLTANGTAMLTMPNCERVGFEPSPGSLGYLQTSEWYDHCRNADLSVAVYGVFREDGVIARRIGRARLFLLRQAAAAARGLRIPGLLRRQVRRRLGVHEIVLPATLPILESDQMPQTQASLLPQSGTCSGFTFLYIFVARDRGCLPSWMET